MDQATARVELEAILDRAMALVPGEWTGNGDALLPCTTAIGVSGDAVSLGFDGPAPENPDAAAEAVAAAWAAEGFDVRSGTLPDGAIQVQFRDAETNLYLQFRARPDRTSVLGESRCVPTQE